MKFKWTGLATLAVIALFELSVAQAHQGQSEAPPTTAPLPARVASSEPPSSARSNPFPVDLGGGGSFSLLDHNGVPRTDQDFHGSYMLLFFGYVNCKSMCTVALRRIAAALDGLGDRADRLQPAMITVDPERDTLEVMRRELPKLHPRMLGLTGSESSLAEAYRAFSLKPYTVGLDPEGDAVLSHSSYAYLMGLEGELLTLIPPILGPERIAEIISSYITEQ